MKNFIEISKIKVVINLIFLKYTSFVLVNKGNTSQFHPYCCRFSYYFRILFSKFYSQLDQNIRSNELFARVFHQLNHQDIQNFFDKVFENIYMMQKMF
jgi:hypothetical protein